MRAGPGARSSTLQCLALPTPLDWEMSGDFRTFVSRMAEVLLLSFLLLKLMILLFINVWW